MHRCLVTPKWPRRPTKRHDSCRVAYKPQALGAIKIVLYSSPWRHVDLAPRPIHDGMATVLVGLDCHHT